MVVPAGMVGGRIVAPTVRRSLLLIHSPRTILPAGSDDTRNDPASTPPNSGRSKMILSPASRAIRAEKVMVMPVTSPATRLENSRRGDEVNAPIGCTTRIGPGYRVAPPTVPEKTKSEVGDRTPAIGRVYFAAGSSANSTATPGARVAVILKCVRSASTGGTPIVVAETDCRIAAPAGVTASERGASASRVKWSRSSTRRSPDARPLGMLTVNVKLTPVTRPATDVPNAIVAFSKAESIAGVCLTRAARNSPGDSTVSTSEFAARPWNGSETPTDSGTKIETALPLRIGTTTLSVRFDAGSPVGDVVHMPRAQPRSGTSPVNFVPR
mmetsp:Transcript_6723/g.16195  ORF Transcript_6723/g.16195 Transcript_6723/m.16195 type:complete len:326 (+) Transcript_6723:2719-3696(+)